MSERLTGKQLRERADACLDQRKPDRETLRAWIGRGADQIDRLSQEVDQLRTTIESGASEAALLVLEGARKAAEDTLDRLHKRELETEVALDQARSATDLLLEEARKASETDAEAVVAEAQSEAAIIMDDARETAQQHAETAEAEWRDKLDSALAKAERVDAQCGDMVAHARALDGMYRRRVSGIKAEANALVTLLERFDALPVTEDNDELDISHLADDVAHDAIDLTSGLVDKPGLIVADALTLVSRDTSDAEA